MTHKIKVEQIYVALVGEGVDVWRPVQAVRLCDNVYRILDQYYDSDIETWEFTPGEEVFCELIDSSGGKIMVARYRA
jgi:hypothetical protein